MTKPNPFKHFWDLGFGPSLVSVSPPDCELDEGSYIAPIARGKAPAIRLPSGKWKGMPKPGWALYKATEADTVQWFSDGANVGLRMDNLLRAIDIDASELDKADAVEKLCIDMLGPSPLRVGRWPRRALLYRLTEDTLCQTISFEGPLVNGEPTREKIEITGAGKQLVIYGRHPSGIEYAWPRRPVKASGITLITPEQFHAWRDAVRALLPKPADSSDSTAADREKVNQATLVGDPEHITDAIRATPNNRNIYPDREHYINMGIALWRALPDDPELAFDLWTEWAAKDNGGVPEAWESDWLRITRLRPPFALGAPHIFRQAEKFGDYSIVSRHFKIVTPEDLEAEEEAMRLRALEPRTESIFDIGERIRAAREAEQARTQAKEQATAEAIKWVRPSEWAGITPPEREWEVPGWIPKGEVTLLYGDGGIGKTLLIHMYATAAAAGIPWLGQPTRKTKVMCFFCEDSEDELLRRQIDINRALGVTFEEIDENLRIASRKYMDNLLILWDRNTGALKRQSIWEQIRDDAVAFGAGVFIGDTIADMFGGNEIDRSQVNAFVKSCLGRLGQEMGGSVIALGHPSMSGKASGSGTSGSTAWNNAVRSRLYLRYPKGVEKGNVRELEGMKLNYGPKGNVIKLRWNRGAFDVVASSMAPFGGDAPKAFEGSVPTLEQASDQVVLDAIVACSGEPVALNMKPNSPHYAPKVLKRREPDLLIELGDEEVAEALGRLEARGVIRAGEVGRDAYRRPVAGYTVVRVEADTVPESVFD